MLKICLIIICTASLALTGSLDNFSLNLYKQIARSNGDKNLVIPPVSVALSSGLALCGASGETFNEIQRALGESNFNDLVRKIEGDSSFASGNKIFLSEKFSLKENYQKIVQKIFNSKAESVDFTNSEKTERIINSWVNQKTNGLIKNLVKNIDPNLVAVIVNAIYFKATWANKFFYDPSKTREFQLSKTRIVEVPFMATVKSLKYGYSSELNLVAVELPYLNTDIKMVILVPREVDGLRNLEENLNVQNFQDIFNGMKFDEDSQVQVLLPRFKIDFETQLNDGLKGLGMRRMFTDGAEFDNLIEGNKALKISKVFQKAVIDVNENGTEAAAGTQMQLVNRISPTRIVADRPFLFLLKNNEHVFFIGRVVDPKYE